MAYKRSGKLKNHDGLWGAIFLSPIAIGMILFILIPIGYAVYLSFTRYDMFNAPTFVGWRNYQRLFDISKETQFWSSFKNIFVFAVLITLLNVFVGLVIACLLKRGGRIENFFKVILYLPMVCSVVATTSIWGWMYNSVYGPLIGILKFFGVERYEFFAPSHVLPSMLLMCLWSGFGGSMLLYFAALKNIPGHLYEAAEIDGATPVQSFFKITLPMVSPTTFYLLLTGLVGSLQAYSQFLAIGLDGYTPVLVIYKYAGHGYGNTTYGYSCAMGVFYGILIAVIAAINFRLSKFWVGYDV
ncbi:MAG: sugar ABC transporter permease [Clostridia bacterium]|nr:sugar ABC transporter permease [Clostridia bacterium]